eukprot:TRINITY_DN19597_c0_g1_i3.p1 TRINITY_DN19597_c0_g1~~TRINITY_DN19597_c0_g1_i3.p1  ORF type:complete len:272 (-),score=49.97 TRINITY_DN19597_c0_g1_i3:231-995(-)
MLHGKHFLTLVCLPWLCYCSGASSAVHDNSSLEALQEVRANETLVRFCYKGHLHPGDLLTICARINGTGNLTEDCQTAAAVAVKQETSTKVVITLRDSKLETVKHTGICRTGAMWTVNFLPPSKQVFPPGSSVEITHTAEGRKWCSGIHALHDALFGQSFDRLLPGKPRRLRDTPEEQSKENLPPLCEDYIDSFNSAFPQQKWTLLNFSHRHLALVTGVALVVLLSLVALLRGCWKKQADGHVQLLGSPASGSE